MLRTVTALLMTVAVVAISVSPSFAEDAVTPPDALGAADDAATATEDLDGIAGNDQAPGVGAAASSPDPWITPLSQDKRGTLNEQQGCSTCNPVRYVVDWRGFRYGYYDPSPAYDQPDPVLDQETLLDRIVFGAGDKFLSGELELLCPQCKGATANFIAAVSDARAHQRAGTYGPADSSRLDHTYGAVQQCLASSCPLRADWVPQDPTVAPIFGLGQAPAPVIDDPSGFEAVIRKEWGSGSNWVYRLHPDDDDRPQRRDVVTHSDRFGIYLLLDPAVALSLEQFKRGATMATRNDPSTIGDTALLRFRFVVGDDPGLVSKVRALSPERQQILLEPLAADWVAAWQQDAFSDIDINTGWYGCPDTVCRNALATYVPAYRQLAYTQSWGRNFAGFVRFTQVMGIDPAVATTALLNASPPLLTEQARAMLASSATATWQRYLTACKYLGGADCYFGSPRKEVIAGPFNGPETSLGIFQDSDD